MGDRAAGTSAAIAVAVLFGSSYVATAFQLRGFTPLGGALWRSAIATVVLTVIWGWRAWRRRHEARRRGPGARSGSAPPLAGRLARLLVLGLLGGLVFIIGMNVAVSRVGAAVTAFVAGLYAVLAALFAPLVLGERLPGGSIAGFLVALVGTALLAQLGASGEATGLAAAGMAAAAFALYLVLIRRWSASMQIEPLGIALVGAATPALGLALLLGLFRPSDAAPTSFPADAAVATVWLVFVAAAGPILTAVALRRIEARRASSMLLLNPITATVLAVIMLGERPSPPQLLGGLLVLAGIAVSSDVTGALRGSSFRLGNGV